MAEEDFMAGAFSREQVLLNLSVLLHPVKQLCYIQHGKTTKWGCQRVLVV